MTSLYVTPTEVEVEVEGRTTASTTTIVGEGRGGGGRGGFEEASSQLQKRGVNATLRSLLEVCSLDAITRTIAWWDGQQTNERPPGPGVLVEVIRRGGMTDQSRPRSRIEQQVEYGEQICDWLNRYFPELQAHSEPHPAAVVAVIQLHYRHGKGHLTKREHGPEIRAAVQRFDAKWLTDEVPA